MVAKGSREYAGGFAPEAGSPRRKRRLTVGKVIRRFFGVILTVVLALTLTLVGVVFLMCKGPSESARDLSVTTLLESGALKFVPSLFLSSEEIEGIVGKTSMQAMDTSVLDANLIDTQQTSEAASELDMDAVTIEEISGRTFFAKLMTVNDPSRVIVGTTYPFTEYGKNLDEIVADYGGVGGVNGGLYDMLKVNGANSDAGGSPAGVVVSGGEIQNLEDLGIPGLYLVGLDTDNLLQIISLAGMSEQDVRDTVASKHIRDAVSFQDEASDANNHFTPIIINGEPREMAGMGSGANPRTVIGQRADGAILLLVTDGRGAQGHLGATASDLITIMMEHGAVNAANIDGGSSSSMVFEKDGQLQYEMTSVTLYYSNASWRMPTAIVVK